MNAIKAQYPIHVSSSCLEELGVFLEENFPEHDVIFLVDENTERDCLPFFNWSNHESLLNAEVLSIPAGEDSKALAIVEQLAASMLDLGLGRKTVLVNIGGGVVTDLGGFLASIYKRGIPFIQLPTSLLAMVDASVGGKTGVNLFGVKNQLGAFIMPLAVFCSTEFLNTLPERELRSGYFEMLKHGLIADENHFRELASSDFNSIPKPELLAASVVIKNDIVEADPQEKGIRKKLNFGHTIGHAIESYSRFKEQPLLHGEAIAIGMVIESQLSHLHAGLTDEERDQIVKLIFQWIEGYPIKEDDFAGLIEYMKADKKNETDKLNFSLLNSIGSSEVNFNLTDEQVIESLNWYLKVCN